MAFVIWYAVCFLNIQMFPLTTTSLHLKSDTKDLNRVRRYAFQITHDCKDFRKAFLCVSECLTRGFQIARSDKHCKCRCFDKKDKQKYNPLPVPTEVPITLFPYWIKKILMKQSLHQKHKKVDDYVKSSNENDDDSDDKSNKDDVSGSTTNNDQISVNSTETSHTKQNAQQNSTVLPTSSSHSDSDHGTTNTHY